MKYVCRQNNNNRISGSCDPGCLEPQTPAFSTAVCGTGILEDNPELLLRMDYYLSDDIRLIDELPIEIQNMMVLGDESGVGFLYRYWKDKRAEQRQQQEQAYGLDPGSVA